MDSGIGPAGHTDTHQFTAKPRQYSLQGTLKRYGVLL
jgi:hypothetical protein